MVEAMDNYLKESEHLLQEHSSWQVTVRSVHLCKDIESGIANILERILRKQGIQSHQGHISGALIDLAALVCNTMYRSIFERIVLMNVKMDPMVEYARINELFEREISRRGAASMARYAREDGRFFEIHVRNASDTILCWVVSPFPLRAVEKQSWLIILDGEVESPKESAWPELQRAVRALRLIGSDTRPIKPVFYPHQTCAGFILNRKEQNRGQSRGTNYE